MKQGHRSIRQRNRVRFSSCPTLQPKRVRNGGRTVQTLTSHRSIILCASKRIAYPATVRASADVLCSSTPDALHLTNLPEHRVWGVLNVQLRNVRLPYRVFDTTPTEMHGTFSGAIARYLPYSRLCNIVILFW